MNPKRAALMILIFSVISLGLPFDLHSPAITPASAQVPSKEQLKPIDPDRISRETSPRKNWFQRLRDILIGDVTVSPVPCPSGHYLSTGEVLRTGLQTEDGSGLGPFGGAGILTKDPAGVVSFLDRQSLNIQRYSGELSLPAIPLSSSIFSDDYLDYGSAIAVASDGSVYLFGAVVPGGSAILKRTPTGEIDVAIHVLPIVSKMLVAGGKLYASGRNSWTSNETEIFRFDLPASPEPLNFEDRETLVTPGSHTIAVDPQGNIFYAIVNVSQSSFVMKRAPDGSVTTIMGGGETHSASSMRVGTEFDPLTFYLPQPNDITADRCGNIFIAAAGQVYRWSPSSNTGKYVLDAGAAIASLEVDHANKLYLVLLENHPAGTDTRTGWTDKLVRFDVASKKLGAD